MNRRAALAAALALAATTASAQEGKTGFLDRTVTVDGGARAYKVYVPPAFDRARAWPVVLFLHGAGESGTDGVQQTEVGLGPALRAHPERYPAVVVFPKIPRREVWFGPQARYATAALRQTMEEFRGDPDRVSVLGLSLGGYGAWVLAAEDPGRYAAVVSVAGGVVPPPHVRARLEAVPETLSAPDPYAATAARVKGIPAWLFHGSEDMTVPVAESRRMVEALKAAGASPKYTEYAGAPHSIWGRTFDEPGFAEWLLAQRRAGSTKR
jgi:predicted peptidase